MDLVPITQRDIDLLYRAAMAQLRTREWLLRTFPVESRAGSQTNEDTILARLLPGRRVYVDIGAGRPKDCSNTWAFYERGGRGLLVEPLKDCVYHLCRERCRDTIFPVAASNASGYPVMRLCRSLSTLQTDWNIEEQCQTIVEAMRTQDILDRFPALRDSCDLLSIDVEGHERQVLEGIDWDRFSPEVICVEWLIYGASAPHNDSSPNWESLLLEQGYRLHAKTDYNAIYVLEEGT